MMNMKFNLVVYLIGVMASMALGLRGIGVFSNNIKFKAKDILFVLMVSILGHWFAAMVFYFGYGKPQEGHPDVI